jgi:hypothetical protein
MLRQITYTSSNTYKRNRARNPYIPKFHRILCGSCGDTLLNLDGFHCRKERWLNFCNCITCSIHFHSHWTELVCILLLQRYMFRRNRDSSNSVRMRTSCRPYLAASMCYRGTNLNITLITLYEWYAWRSVFSFSVVDRFGDGDGFVAGEVSDIIRGWSLCRG